MVKSSDFSFLPFFPPAAAYAYDNANALTYPSLNLSCQLSRHCLRRVTILCRAQRRIHRTSQNGSQYGSLLPPNEDQPACSHFPLLEMFLEMLAGEGEGEGKGKEKERGGRGREKAEEERGKEKRERQLFHKRVNVNGHFS